MSTTAYLPMGAFSRLVGVSPELLRAWERRYGLPRPVRTANGRRLYSDADEQLVRAMRQALADGHPAGEAAKLAGTAKRLPATRPAVAGLDGDRRALRDALADFDDTRAQTVLDRVFGAYSIDTVLAQVVLPYLRELGERWACGEAGVSQEHFASSVVHGRLLSLARKWDEGHGPRALLACPQGELHTIGLLAFGLTLRMHGWRITYLGADTPIDTLADVADAVEPSRVVLASVRTEVLEPLERPLTALAERTRLSLGGAGATPQFAARVGAPLLEGDPVAAAERLAWAETGMPL